MFGHQDDQQDHHDLQPAENLIPAPTIDGILSSDPQPVVSSPITSDSPATDQTVTSSYNPAVPATDFQPNENIAPPADPVITMSAPIVSDTPPEAAVPAVVPNEPVVATPDTNGLLDIKQQALTELSPLVGHLDQSPEEKFRTTMMMIQASDNQDLIKTAYEAAQAMTDEKTKAQALLDIVNEINYFTQSTAAA